MLLVLRQLFEVGPAVPVSGVGLPVKLYDSGDQKSRDAYSFRKNCLICHTARYVSIQPRFSKTVWQNEVTTMFDAYAAPISEADQVLVVEYLVALKVVEAPATGAALSK